MISRYWEHCIVLLLVLTVLITPFASGISLAGMFLIFAFLLILRVFIRSFVKLCKDYKKLEEKVQILHEAIAPENSAEVMEAEVQLEKANKQRQYELKSIILVVLFIAMWIFLVDWNDLAANFLNWANH